jgi:hypothetical protein
MVGIRSPAIFVLTIRRQARPVRGVRSAGFQLCRWSSSSVVQGDDAVILGQVDVDLGGIGCFQQSLTEATVFQEHRTTLHDGR